MVTAARNRRGSMTESSSLEMPLVQSVFHPSDFSEASESAFAHALAISLLRQTRLTILHASPEHHGGNDWSRFPAVRATLERWKLLEPGSPRSAVLNELGIRVEKIAVASPNPLSAALEYLEQNPTDLMVLATQGREGLPRWVRRSVAERLAHQSRTMSLFVPAGSRGFVAVEDGHLSLRRILIPVDHHPSAQAAIQFATRAARVMGDECVEIALLHVGNSNPVADLSLPQDPAWSWSRRQQSGDVMEGIVATADDFRPDMIAMVTEGHEGVLDALRGSITEQVLRRTNCPVLAVPAAWIEEVSPSEKI
jgi:nucleotide-binding universal stress UspA family protein